MVHLSASIQSAIQQKLSKYFSVPNSPQFHSVGGGSINETYGINFGEQSVFCKLNSAPKFPQLFAKEQNGLALISKQGVIKTPVIIDCFEHDGSQVLLLEWIHEAERTEAFWKTFGAQLAALHQQTNKYFGLEEYNYMGSVPQSNRQHLAWAQFFIEERIQPLIAKCYERDLLTTQHIQQFERLNKKLETIFQEEKPCLLHGDLWSGNFMCSSNSHPVLIDPAVYYGHRSADLAMTTLFGGFHQSFYEAYHYHFPYPYNYKEQWQVCNLYPLLIHLYLFGNSYLPQIDATLKMFS